MVNIKLLKIIATLKVTPYLIFFFYFLFLFFSVLFRGVLYSVYVSSISSFLVENYSGFGLYEVLVLVLVIYEVNFVEVMSSGGGARLTQLVQTRA